MSEPLLVDIAIIGGGIAGLWLLSRLQGRGYGVLLIEGERLGAGQTICSQGIIHGGTKYALLGELSNAAQAVGAMPGVWRRCLAGEGEVDLSGVKVLSDYQYLWTSQSLSSRLSGFFASKAMRSRMETVASDDFPTVLRHKRFRGSVYRLDEPVLDMASLLKALAERSWQALVRHPVALTADGAITLRLSGQDPVVVRAQRTVLTAGIGNALLSEAPMQLRPLHMVMMRSEALADDLYGHCLGAGNTPRLTITCHRDAAGRSVWYLGGQLAETGIDLNSEQQIDAARWELAAVLPWVDLSQVQFATVRIARAEARQPGGRRPDTPDLFQSGRVITAWPTKLAMAPMLADAILTLLERDGIQPHDTDLSPMAAWPRPDIANYPWDEERQWY